MKTPETKTDNATPRPWQCDEHKFNLPPFEGSLENEWGIYPPIGESGPVAIVSGKHNAALIVAAVNQHDALLAVAEAAKAMLSTGNGGATELRQALSTLSKIQGEAK